MNNMRMRKDVLGRLGDRWLSSPIFRDLRQLTIISISIIGLSISLLVVQRVVASPPCPCTIFSANQPASNPGLFNESGGIELGIKMRFDHDGYITGIRFYKIPGMGGVHSASLWNFDGTVRMANATFVNESASGWQEVQFAPVAVTANATYTASVFMADGNYTATSNYFTSQINNSPFIIQKSGEAWDGTGNSGQGTFKLSSNSVYPNGSFNASNYWIDATHVSSPDISPPSITAQTPAANSTNVPITDSVTATFDKRLDPASVTSSTVFVTDDQNQLINGAVSYDAATSTLKFIADALWENGKTYTVTLKGSSPMIQDFEGHSLAADYSWSFTASSTPLLCPCSLQNNQLPTDSTTYREEYANGLELGQKIVPNTNGYITALRFYKPLISPDSSRAGHIWDAQGNLLATVNTAHESDYGWQEVPLAAPLSVSKDQLYVISFGFAVGDYQATFGKFTAPMVSPGFTAYPSNDSHNTAVGNGTANAVYATAAGSYPSNPSNNNPYYYIDAVFSKQIQDKSPLSVVSVEPANDSYAVKRSTPIRITFDQALNAASVTAANVQLRDDANQLVPRSIEYDQARHAIVIKPAGLLEADTNYTVTIASGAADVRGVALGSDYSWSFTTGASAAPINSSQGAGGPILVVTAPGDPYGSYYAEILRTEGIPYFSVKDTSQLTSSVLAQYMTVLLAQANLSQSQVDVLDSWVSTGGNLVAMRPDKKLAGLLGLTDTGATNVNQYLRVDPSTRAGAGIVSQSIQFKGVADRYVASNAMTVAQLYSDATTSTTHPAVTTRVVGQGSASAFSYDLARSVIALHQGNQAWSAQDRDRDGVRRTNDLFYGAMNGDNQPDWLDQTKVAIPQADEQQRLLINIMTDAMKKRLPAPRFWYLPGDYKAALVLAGDDHNLSDNEGTRRRFNDWLNLSPIGCSLTDWHCVRASHYVYVGSALTNAQAMQLAGYGFEIGDHPSDNQLCSDDQSYAELYAQYSSDMTAWRAKYSGLPKQVTTRYHCYAWNDWDMVSRTNQALGIKYDLNTVAYPVGWVSSRSPMVTGSGMNMRLTDASGAMLDVHQGVTNFDNTAGDSVAIAAMFDNAVGVNGYYGLFGSHYDMVANNKYHDTLVSLAKSRNIPVISAEQALEWLSGREQSTISSLSSAMTGQVTFRITTAEGAHGLQAMIPLQDAGGHIVSLLRDNQSVAYRTEVIKGVSYAIFEAQSGEYEARYSDYGQVANKPIDNMTTVKPVNLSSRQMTDASVAANVASESESQAAATLPRNAVASQRNSDDSSALHQSSTPWYGTPIAWVVATGVSGVVIGVGWRLIAMRRYL